MGRFVAFRRVGSNSNVYVLCVGGNYNANTNYGLFYFNANNSASNANANIGSRHLVYDSMIYHCVGKYRSTG